MYEIRFSSSVKTLLAHHSLWSLAYPLITQTPLTASNLIHDIVQAYLISAVYLHPRAYTHSVPVFGWYTQARDLNQAIVNWCMTILQCGCINGVLELCGVVCSHYYQGDHGHLLG